MSELLGGGALSGADVHARAVRGAGVRAGVLCLRVVVEARESETSWRVAQPPILFVKPTNTYGARATVRVVRVLRTPTLQTRVDAWLLRRFLEKEIGTSNAKQSARDATATKEDLHQADDRLH